MANIWTLDKSYDKCSSKEYHADSEQNAEYAYTKTLQWTKYERLGNSYGH